VWLADNSALIWNRSLRGRGRRCCGRISELIAATTIDNAPAPQRQSGGPGNDQTWLGSHGPPWCCPQRCPRESTDRRVRPFCRHDLRDAATIDVDQDLCTAPRYLTALAEATQIDDHPRWDRTTATIRFEAFCDLIADKRGIDALATLGSHSDSGPSKTIQA
jgi:hypothetical protein